MCASLPEADSAAAALAEVLLVPPEQCVFNLEDTISQVFYAIVTVQHTIIVEPNHDKSITVTIVPRWTPKLRAY